MSRTLVCPRCRRPLATTDDAEEWTCNGCHGRFISGAAGRLDLLDPQFLGEPPSAEERQAGEPTASPCPACGIAMRSFVLAEASLDRCPSCGGRWMDGPPPPTPPFPPLPRGGKGGMDAEVSVSSLARGLLYSLTLPERALRSGVGLAAGAVRESAAWLVPQAFQNSRTYSLVVKNSLRFLAEDVGGVAAKPGAPNESAPEQYIARKAVGNFVDLAALATLHVSPAWILAIVSDVAYGTKSYVHELAAELRREGLIDEKSTIDSVDDVLNALQDATGRTAVLFDTPPLSIDEMKRTLAETRQAVQSADLRGVLPQAELQKYWQEMRDIADREGQSLLGVSAAVTLRTLQKVGTVARGTLCGVQVVGGLFNRHVLGHYVESLETVRQRGFYATLQESAGPYIEAVGANFAAGRSTWTEELLSGRAIRRGVGAIVGWLTRRGRGEQSADVSAGS
ncbi:MAG: zf-TFIIB domain-containing protein [Planctomycetes bacterium]|nr:zf-TFIIB domain-containing protein [Planctomycetota bacterium]